MRITHRTCSEEKINTLVCKRIRSRGGFRGLILVWINNIILITGGEYTNP